MRILITGICGFVGSTIAKRWKATDPAIQIVGVDNFARRGSWRNVERLQALGINVLHGDIRKRGWFPSAA